MANVDKQPRQSNGTAIPPSTPAIPPPAAATGTAPTAASLRAVDLGRNRAPWLKIEINFFLRIFLLQFFYSLEKRMKHQLID